MGHRDHDGTRVPLSYLFTGDQDAGFTWDPFAVMADKHVRAVVVDDPESLMFKDTFDAEAEALRKVDWNHPVVARNFVLPVASIDVFVEDKMHIQRLDMNGVERPEFTRTVAWLIDLQSRYDICWKQVVELLGWIKWSPSAGQFQLDISPLVGKDFSNSLTGVKHTIVSVDQFDKLLRLFGFTWDETSGRISVVPDDPTALRNNPFDAAWFLHYRASESHVREIGLDAITPPGDTSMVLRLAKWMQLMVDSRQASGFKFPRNIGFHLEMFRDPLVLSKIFKLNGAFAGGWIGEAFNMVDQYGNIKRLVIGEDGTVSGYLFDQREEQLSSNTRGDERYVEGKLSEDGDVEEYWKWLSYELKTYDADDMRDFAPSMIQSLMARIAGIGASTKINWDHPRLEVGAFLKIPMGSTVNVARVDSNFMRLLMPSDPRVYKDKGTYEPGIDDISWNEWEEKYFENKEFGFSTGKNYGLYRPDKHKNTRDIFVMWQARLNTDGTLAVDLKVGRVQLNGLGEPQFETATSEPVWTVVWYNSFPGGSHISSARRIIIGFTEMDEPYSFYSSYRERIRIMLSSDVMLRRRMVNPIDPTVLPLLEDPLGLHLLQDETMENALELCLKYEEPHLHPLWYWNHLMPLTRYTPSKFYENPPALSVLDDPDAPMDQILAANELESILGTRTRMFVAVKPRVQFDPVSHVFPLLKISTPIFIPTNLLAEASRLKIFDQIDLYLNELADKMNSVFRNTARDVLGLSLADIFRGSSEINPLLNRDTISFLRIYTQQLLDDIIKKYPLTRGNEVFDDRGLLIAGERAARQRLLTFIQVLDAIVSDVYETEYVTEWRGRSALFLLNEDLIGLSPLAEDIIDGFNQIFEILFKGVPGTEVTDISHLFDLASEKPEFCVSHVSRLLLMAYLGAVSYEHNYDNPIARDDLLLTAVIEILFMNVDDKTRIGWELNILADCNGMAIDYSKGVEEHDGYIYAELYLIRDSNYRVLCRVNKATRSLVRDGVEIFYTGTEISPGQPSATMETFKRAALQCRILDFLDISPRFKTRLIFDVIRP